MAQFLETATEIARESGALLSRYFERRIGYELKGDYDLVTDADRASEKLIVERLQTHFPTHGILGEESGLHASRSEYHWYVDPLDGTTNFAHSYPAFNVTLALERDRELIAGVIFDPIRDEMFTAELGGGAFLNGKRISVSQSKDLETSLLATGFPSRKRHENINVHFWHQVAMVTHGVRRSGSAAIDLAYVACGRLDGFWEFGLNPWDMAAGLLLVKEAGGAASDMKGGAADIKGRHIAADNGKIHAELIQLFREVFEGRYRHPMPQVNAES
jgi:myo-inositol-1(or 4)-monophosphatase